MKKYIIESTAARAMGNAYLMDGVIYLCDGGIMQLNKAFNFNVGAIKHLHNVEKDVTEKCGLPFEYFLRIATTCDTEKLYQAAKQNIDRF